MSKLQGNYTLLLKTTLIALPSLVDILKPFKSEIISGIRNVCTKKIKIYSKNIYYCNCSRHYHVLDTQKC